MNQVPPTPVDCEPPHDTTGTEEWPAALREQCVLLGMFSAKPEPPTMNAILVLKQCFGRVLLVRNNMSFPANYYLDPPELLEIGAPCDSNLAATRNAFWKLARFIRYAWALCRQLAYGRYQLVILHDYLALLAFYLVRRVAKFRG